MLYLYFDVLERRCYRSLIHFTHSCRVESCETNGKTTPESKLFLIVVFSTGHDGDGQSPSAIGTILQKVAVVLYDFSVNEEKYTKLEEETMLHKISITG